MVGTAQLRVIASARTDLVGRTLEVREGSTLGQAPDDDGSSDWIARVISAPIGLMLIDQGSIHGLHWNEQRVPSLPLRSGARFRMGSTTWEVLDGESDVPLSLPKVKSARPIWITAFVLLIVGGIGLAVLYQLRRRKPVAASTPAPVVTGPSPTPPTPAPPPTRHS